MLGTSLTFNLLAVICNLLSVTTINLENPDPDIVKRAVETVTSGGVVLYPADTIYGLGCDPFKKRALERIFELKGRCENRGVLLLIPDLAWIERLTSGVCDQAMEFCQSVWPGPVTVLFKASYSLPELVLGEGGTVGLRLPDSLFLSNWLDELNGPMVSTSANVSGEDPTGIVEDLRAQFGNKVDLLIDGGDLPHGVPSTVVGFSGERPTIIRKGSGLERVEQLI